MGFFRTLIRPDHEEAQLRNQSIIANAAKMYEKEARIFLDMFTFPTNEDQISKVWLGGAVQKFTKEVADFFVAQKQMEKALESYDAHITDAFVK